MKIFKLILIRIFYGIASQRTSPIKHEVRGEIEKFQKFFQL